MADLVTGLVKSDFWLCAFVFSRFGRICAEVLVVNAIFQFGFVDRLTGGGFGLAGQG